MTDEDDFVESLRNEWNKLLRYIERKNKKRKNPPHGSSRSTVWRNLNNSKELLSHKLKITHWFSPNSSISNNNNIYINNNTTTTMKEKTIKKNKKYRTSTRLMTLAIYSYLKRVECGESE
jgi:hypothetical protein